MKQKQIVKIESCKKQAKRFSTEQKKISIGSDCELSFALYKPLIKNFFCADNFLTASLTTQLGCDGNSRIAEIRPNYSYNPLEHASNIKKIVKRLMRKMSSKDAALNAYAGNGFGSATGGHIHFGIQLDSYTKQIISFLDLMSIFLLPLENKRLAKKRRKRSGYGHLGAYELKSYGFEYRTPASWLYSESITKSILSLAHTMAYEFINNREHAIKMMMTFKNRFNMVDINGRFNNAESRTFIINNFNFYKYFMKNVRKMIEYQNYKPYIESLFSLHVLKKKFKETSGIRAGWGSSNKIFYCLFRFSNDDYLDEIKCLIGACNLESKDDKSEDKNIFVFGLARDRPYSIETNNQHIFDLVEGYLKSNNLSLTIKLINRYDFSSIGFRWDLRKENQDLIRQILRHIFSNIDTSKLTEKNFSYENLRAQTDCDNDNEHEYELNDDGSNENDEW
jgi:hypothetical protein